MRAAGRFEYLTNTVPIVDLRIHPRESEVWTPALCLHTGQPSLTVNWLERSQVRHRTVLVEGSYGAYTQPSSPPIVLTRLINALGIVVQLIPQGVPIASAQPQGPLWEPQRVPLTYLTQRE